MSQARAQSISSLHAVPQGPQAESDRNARLVSVLHRLDQQSSVGGFTGTIATAKLTGGGANGSMVFVNGRVVSQTAAT